MMKRILTYFGQDGLLHILCSLVLCAVLAAFLPWWAAALITLAIGIAKELVWDRWLKKGTAEWKDIIADAVGIALGAVLELSTVLMQWIWIGQA